MERGKKADFMFNKKNSEILHEDVSRENPDDMDANLFNIDDPQIEEISIKLRKEAETNVKTDWEKEKKELEEKIEFIKELVKKGVPVFESKSSYMRGNDYSADSWSRDEQSGGIKIHSSHYIGGVDSSNHNRTEKWTPPHEWIHLVTNSGQAYDYSEDVVKVRHIVEGQCLLELENKRSDAVDSNKWSWIFQQWDLHFKGSLKVPEIRELYEEVAYNDLGIADKRSEIFNNFVIFLKENVTE